METAAAGFAVLFLLLVARIPVGIAMIAVGTLGFASVVSFDAALSILSISPFRTLTTEGFILVSLFILMGELATKSGLSAELFRAGNAWFGHFRGGLAMATIAASGGFAAICGSSVATAATMTKVALPEMRRYRYSDRLATGAIAAGGTLGILIPPSVVLAVYGILTEQDIGKLFMAGILPGLIAIVFYLAAVRFSVWRDPDAGPVAAPAGWRERFAALRGVWAIAAVFAGIIGGMFFGVFTPSEAAAIGVVLTLLIGILRRRLDAANIVRAVKTAIQLSASIFLILIGSYIFGFFLAVTQAPQGIAAAVAGLPLPPYGVLAIMLVLYLLLGCVLDTLAMLVLTVPITFPIAMNLGFDPIWFGIIIVMTIELGLITPPIGMNVFVIRSVAQDVSLATVFKGALPFVAVDILRLAVLAAFPALTLFLPDIAR